jgi:3-isopropylmalate/(R)-2-methylmalate dehydratase small subunit
MKIEYTGAVWRFGDSVTTDDILPGQFLDRKNSEVGQFAFAGINPEFAANVKPGDIVVAGKNFGVGSGRESAVFAIQGAGVSVVIAESFARLFFRNAINNGLIPVMIDASASIAQDHRVTVDIANRVVTDLTANRSHPILNLNGISRDILDAGGIVPFIERRLATKTG